MLCVTQYYGSIKWQQQKSNHPRITKNGGLLLWRVTLDLQFIVDEQEINFWLSHRNVGVVCYNSLI